MRQYAVLFERLKLHTFETAESGVDKVVSSCEKNPSVLNAYTNFLRQRKTALDVPLHAVSSGRSMIEMLGVLAIIGVLSIGGIAGYSKAMQKWNSNQQKEQISQILHSFLRLRYQLSREKNLPTEKYELMSILNNLDEVPAGLTYTNGGLVDKFGNSYTGAYGENCWQTKQDSDGMTCSVQLSFTVSLVKTDSSLTPSSADFCENMIYLAKENSQDISSIITFLGNTKDDNDPTHWRGYTQKSPFNQATLPSATPMQIKKVCQECKNHSNCKVSIHLKTS